MILTDYEKALLNGDFGQEARQLMEIMLKIAEINGARELVTVRHVMIGNTGMLSISGETGINFLTRLADAGIKFSIPTYTNVVSIDTSQWKELGIPEDYARTQLRGIEAWRDMGAILSLSCMPMLCGAIPKYGDHVAYADSAPVIFGNSCFGARTNRESDLTTMAAAICGRIPSFGYHLDENRAGQVLVQTKAALKEEADYDALGYYVGKIVKDRVPVFADIDPNISNQSLIQLGSALAASGTVALFHCIGVTPEIKNDPDLYGKKHVTEEITVTEEDMKSAYRELNTTSDHAIDFVYIGCPHFTIEKLKNIAGVLSGKRIHKDTAVWLAVSATVRELGLRTGDVQRIEQSGARVLSDCCVVTLPVSLCYRNMATDSAKARIYMSDFGLNVRFGSTVQCLEAGIRGSWEQESV